jgi:methionine--tRNA ligase beta chain
VGDHQRQVLAGLRQWYEPAELVGKQVVVVVNLAPRKMRGLESQGMLLAASTTEDDSRDVVFLTTEKPVPAGSKVS